MKQIEIFRAGAQCGKCGSEQLKIAAWHEDIHEEAGGYVGVGDGLEPLIYCAFCRALIHPAPADKKQSDIFGGNL